MGNSIWSKDLKSKHVMDLKVIIKAQNISFEKVEDQNHADYVKKTGRDS
jgi:hypothetical protein